MERLNDQERLGLTFDHIIHASGSGGTQGGLVVGKEFTGWIGKISGISVAMKREVLENKVYGLSSETADILGGRVDRRSVVVDDNYIGEGYAIRTERAEKAIEIFSRREGIFLDHVYTGKVAGALLDRLEKFRSESAVYSHRRQCGVICRELIKIRQYGLSGSH